MQINIGSLGGFSPQPRSAESKRGFTAKPSLLSAKDKAQVHVPALGTQQKESTPSPAVGPMLCGPPRPLLLSQGPQASQVASGLHGAPNIQVSFRTPYALCTHAGS